MEDLFRHLNEKNQLWGSCTFADREFIDVSEIWRNPSLGSQANAHRKIPRDDLNTWLNEEKNKVTAGVKLSSVLRMVWVERKINPSERRDLIDQDSLQRILDAFNLNLANGYYSTAFAGMAALPPHQVSNTEIRSYSFSYHPKLAVIWSQDVAANLTQGICFGGPAQISAFKQLLDTKWQFTNQAMAIAFLCSLLLSSEIDRDKTLIKQEVREVEIRTGYHRWAPRDERPATGDLAALSAKMSGCATKIASCDRKIKVVLELSEFITQQLREPPPQLWSVPDVGDGDLVQSPHASYHISKRVLEDSISLVQKRANMQQIDTEFFQSRITIQLSALFNLIAQNDALVSYEVAKDSKIVAIASQRDSSSMKVLSVVTMFFLPGTFLASLFSMSLSDWNIGFGVYWAIALPLTLFTFMVWGAWTTFQHVKNRNENIKAKTELEERLAESEIGALVVKRRRTGTMTGLDTLS